MKSFISFFDKIASKLSRAFMRFLTSNYPRSSYDGIDLIVADQKQTHLAEQFFNHTSEALAIASSAPQVYTKLLQDIKQIVLWHSDRHPPYNRYQLAVIVPPRILFKVDATCYAAWLLDSSGRSNGKSFSHQRVESFLNTLDSDEKIRVNEWLADTIKEERMFGQYYRKSIKSSNGSCPLENTPRDEP